MSRRLREVSFIAHIAKKSPTFLEYRFTLSPAICRRQGRIVATQLPFLVPLHHSKLLKLGASIHTEGFLSVLLLLEEKSALTINNNTVSVIDLYIKLCVCLCPSGTRLTLPPLDRSSPNLVGRHCFSRAAQRERDKGGSSCISRPKSRSEVAFNA